MQEFKACQNSKKTYFTVSLTVYKCNISRFMQRYWKSKKKYAINHVLKFVILLAKQFGEFIKLLILYIIKTAYDFNAFKLSWNRYLDRKNFVRSFKCVKNDKNESRI